MLKIAYEEECAVSSHGGQILQRYNGPLWPEAHVDTATAQCIFISTSNTMSVSKTPEWWQKNKLKLVTFITTQSHPACVASLVGAEPDTVQKHQRRHYWCEWVITVALTHFTSTKQRATPTSRVACEAAAAAATAQKKKEDELSHPGVALSRTRHLWNLYGFHICIFLLASILSSIIPMKCRLGLNPAVKNRLESG